MAVLPAVLADDVGNGCVYEGYAHRPWVLAAGVVWYFTFWVDCQPLVALPYHTVVVVTVYDGRIDVPRVVRMRIFNQYGL